MYQQIQHNKHNIIASLQRMNRSRENKCMFISLNSCQYSLLKVYIEIARVNSMQAIVLLI